MARWLVQLAGDRMDLEEYPRWFPDGDVFSVEEEGSVFLVGPRLEALPSSEAVLKEAASALARFTAVISLLWSGLNRPTIAHVIREEDDGTRKTFIFLTGSASGRSKASGVGASLGGPPQPPQPTQAQTMLSRAVVGSHLDQALSLWADPLRSWGRLYRILEEIEGHLGQPVDAAGLCSSAERTRFTRTANSAEAAGADARHASGKFDPPANPMTVREGTAFVAKLLAAVLR